ncbi:MAG: DUF4199 domain-containing protein [Bacteroidales bacterium]|nr:DUF4199 domain-containing protein [Bacteroidales bacterium]
MEESFTKKDFWDGAGKAGIVLGAVPILYMLIEQLLLQNLAEQIGAFPSTLVTLVLWAAKFVGCILLMRWYMKRFAAQHENVTRRDANRFGCAIALTSALIYSAFVLAWSKFIDPDMFARAFETAAEQYASFMDSNTLDMMEQMKGNMPVIAFFSNFIYCFLFGVILSAILAPGIGKDTDPFSKDNNPFSNEQ